MVREYGERCTEFKIVIISKMFKRRFIHFTYLV